MFKAKKWLIIKGILALFYIIAVFFVDNSDPFNKFMRIISIVGIVFIFLVDLSEYREKQK